MQRSSSDRDFAGYNAAQAERPVRPLARTAVSLMSEGLGTLDPRGTTADAGTRHSGTAGRTGKPTRVAVELGSGAGVETRFLAENGFAVHSYDADPSVEQAMARHTRGLPIAHTTADLAQIDAYPAADLILSCATLPFVRRAAFPALWRRIREALRPGGILAVDLFGDRDEWAGTDGTFLTRGEVEQLLAGLEVLELVEEERDGRSFRGPKHWHTYRVLARQA